MFSLNTLTSTMLSALLCGSALMLAAPSAHAEDTETAIHTFTGTTSDGSNPYAGLTAGSNNLFYGTTAYGGTYNDGTVYSVTESGTVTILHSFNSSATDDGFEPLAGVTLGSDGSLYGTTLSGGADKKGTVYKINPSGTFSVLHSFTGTTDGARSQSAITIGSDGKLYGTADPDTQDTNGSGGTIYSMNTDGSSYLVQYRFPSPDSNGDFIAGTPHGTLTQVPGSTVAFYGTAAATNTNGGGGAVYKFTPGASDGGGTITILHTFGDGSVNDDGAIPEYGRLALDSSGNIYGTTANGGTSGYGTVFKLTSSGTETILHSLSGSTEGCYPYGSVILGSDGNLYGTTNTGTSQGTGTIFKVTPAGQFTYLYDFNDDNANDGSYAYDAPVEDSAGNLLGTTYSNNASSSNPGDGVIYKLAAGIPTPETVSKVSLSPTTVVGGSANSTGTVTLATAAPTGGLVVKLASSNTSAATVPSSVTVAANSETATFTVTSHSVSAAATATIAATYNSSSASANLTVTPPPTALKSVTLSPTSTTGGTSTTANRIYLTGDATANEVVTLAVSNQSVATLPSNTITISSGASSHTFTINAQPVTSTQTVTILATLNGVTQAATLTVTPALMVSSVTLSPASVVGGQANSTGTVTLNAAAPSGGAVVTLSSSNSSAGVPSTVTVAAGAKTATFTVTTSAVTAQTTATIAAIYGGVYQSAALTVTPPASSGATLKSVTLSPTSTEGGSAATTANRVYFTSAPTSNQTVTLTSSNTAVATVASSVTVSSGSTSHTFTITTKAVTSQQTVTITANSGGVTQTATLTVTP